MKLSTRGVTRGHYIAIALTAVLGTVASLAAFLLVLSWEYRLAEIGFQSKAKSCLQAINADLRDASTLLYTLGAYIDTNDHAVSRPQFDRFAKVLMHDRAVGLRDVGWAPRVTLAQRAGFERTQRLSGIDSGYRIVERGPGGTLVAAQARSAYYPIAYLESDALKGAAVRRVLGFDLASEPLRSAAIGRAVRSGRPAATPALQLITVKGSTGGVIGFMSVGGPRGRSGVDRPAGVVFGVFETAAMIDDIVAKQTAANGLDLYFFDPASSAHRPLYWRSSSPDRRQPPSEAAELAAPHWIGAVSMIDRRWGAVVTPTAPLRRQDGSWHADLTLAIGLTITLMVVAYLLIALRRTKEIGEMARHDALTGLPNRFLFRERLEEAVTRERDDPAFAICYLDLDNFKIVNDTLGHAVGDRLLRLAATRIAGCLREGDTIARLGGDEFALILMGESGRDNIAHIAGRLIEEVGRPYAIDEHIVVVGVSIGIAPARAGAHAADELLKEADLALYAAKDAGRGTYRFFETHLRLEFEARRVLETDLRRALERGEFEVYYQPIINLAQGRVAAFEALVRWHHPEQGLLGPDRFIAVAEECGLIVPLGQWTLRTACEQAAGWPAPVKVAVNVSSAQLRGDGFRASVAAALTGSGLPPGRLEIEIAEAALLHDSATPAAVLQDLRAMGVSLALDDFGTGLSSLYSVLRFPFDKLKIDRSFLDLIDTSGKASAIVRTIVGLGENLGLITTGEGVESHEQLADLRRFGCTEAQGHFFSDARPNADVARLIRDLRTPEKSAIAPLGV